MIFFRIIIIIIITAPLNLLHFSTLEFHKQSLRDFIQYMEKRANANSRTEDLTTSSPQTPSCYETLFREKENALGLQDASGHVSNSRKAYAILRSLYRRYETITKINLYKDYANDYTRRPEKWDQLRQDIQNHGKQICLPIPPA